MFLARDFFSFLMSCLGHAYRSAFLYYPDYYDFRVSYFLCYSESMSTPGKLKNMPDHGGNRTYDL